MNVVLVAIGGFLGATARYFVSIRLSTFKSDFPPATFIVNITGSFLLGLLFGIMPSSNASLLFGVGFLGSYTTFSTLKVEIIRQFREKKWKTALAYMICSYIVGILLAYLGILIGLKLKQL